MADYDYDIGIIGGGGAARKARVVSREIDHGYNK